MTHPLVTFDLQILRPVHSDSKRLCGYVAKLSGFRSCHVVMMLDQCSSVDTFRKYLLEQGSFHFCLNEHDLASFLASCFNACKEIESLSVSDAHEWITKLNSSAERSAFIGNGK